MKRIQLVFWVLIVTFVLLVSYFVIPLPEPIKQKLILLVAGLAFVFLILGILLIFLARKEKGKRKFFLILTGASAAGFLVSVILHNLLYALAIVSKNILVLKYIFEFLHGAFFLVGLIGCPVAFIVGMVGYFVNGRS